MCVCVGGGGLDPWTMTYVKIIIISVPVMFLESMSKWKTKLPNCNNKALRRGESAMIVN